MANTFAMTVLLIALGLTKNPTMAAEVGVVQAVTLALLYAFSANARSLILNGVSGVSAHSVLLVRCLLLLPLAVACYWLSVDVAKIELALALILILRRCVEWLGEVHLSEMERLEHHNFARNYVVLQSVLLGVLLVWLIADAPYKLVVLFIWAAAPLLMSFGFISRLLVSKQPRINGSSLRKLLPNLGSTAIIGITVYIFRLLILLVAGKETAGDLYTAFAIGGVTGSVFANALGASAALHEQRSGKSHLPRPLRYALTASVLLGIALFFASAMKMPFLLSAGKTFFFWEATGLSLIGGFIMVRAQQIRFRLLQHDSDHDVFGPDVFINILAFTSVPFAFYIFGERSLASLFLLSALMSYVFYRSARKETFGFSVDLLYSPRVYKAIRFAIPFFLVFPLFFQLSKGIFVDTTGGFSSDGTLKNLPLPVSIIACAAGILLLRTYRRASLSFGYIFLTCALMAMSSIILTQDSPSQQQAKFILLIQFTLPMFALVLGQVYEPVTRRLEDHAHAKAFLWLLFITVPLQLYLSHQLGIRYLTPDLGLFAIYQYLQYVPVIFVSAYLLTIFTLWNRPAYRIALTVATMFMAAYVSASTSFLAISLFLFGLTAFAAFPPRVVSRKIPALLLVFAVLLSWAYYQYEKKEVAFKFTTISEDVQTLSKAGPTAASADAPASPAPSISLPVASDSVSKRLITLPANLAQRFYWWTYYVTNVTSSAKSFFIGNSIVPDRAQYPSAHNYYLDFIYNFGAIALLPTLLLLAATLLNVFRHRRLLLQSPSLLALSLVVIFLLVADNALKVSLRQPYSGIFTFFLWGMLITRLQRMKNEPTEEASGNVGRNPVTAAASEP
jgi:hypothetical protein